MSYLLRRFMLKLCAKSVARCVSCKQINDTNASDFYAHTAESDCMGVMTQLHTHKLPSLNVASALQIRTNTGSSLDPTQCDDQLLSSADQSSQQGVVVE